MKNQHARKGHLEPYSHRHEPVGTNSHFPMKNQIQGLKSSASETEEGSPVLGLLRKYATFFAVGSQVLKQGKKLFARNTKNRLVFSAAAIGVLAGSVLLIRLLRNRDA